MTEAMAEYKLPDVSILAVPPTPSVLHGLEYFCLAHKVQCPSADSLRSHVESHGHKKKLQEANMVEDPYILDSLTKYAELEAPHRQEKKTQAGLKAKDWLDKCKNYRKSLSGEELKQHTKDRKRKAVKAEPEELSAKKKPRVSDSYACLLCKVAVGLGHDIVHHMESPAHAALAERFAEGCVLCGVSGGEGLTAHLEGERHKKAIARLEACGVRVVEGLGPPPPAPAAASRQPARQPLPVTRKGAAPKAAVAGNLASRAAMAALPAAPLLSMEDCRIDAFICKVCKVELVTLGELLGHMQSVEHQENAGQFTGGCDLCGVVLGNEQGITDHYQGKLHCKRVARLENFGLDMSAYKFS